MELDEELKLLEGQKTLLDSISENLKKRLARLEGGVGKAVRHKSNSHPTDC